MQGFLSTRGFFVITLTLIASASFVLGCESPIGPFRATTMPPDLRYLPPEQIRTAMWVLAAEIRELERVLDAPGPTDQAARQSDVRARLARMRVATETLDVSGKTTQHPILNRNLDRFLTRIRRAERAVDRDPPNYFPATTIAGSCFVCHGQTVGLGPGPDGRRYLMAAALPHPLSSRDSLSRVGAWDSKARGLSTRPE